MLSNLGTCTQLLLEYVGQDLIGPEISSETKLSLSDHSIVITHTVSCARNWDMDPTTEASPKPSPSRPTSPSQLSSGSSQSTSKLSLPFYDGIYGPTINSNELGSLLHLLAENVGSLCDVTIQLLNGRELRIT